MQLMSPQAPTAIHYKTQTLPILCRGAQNGGRVEDVDIAWALIKKATTTAIRRHQTEERLQREGKAARRKIL